MKIPVRVAAPRAKVKPEAIIWLIVAIVVMVAKGLGKLSESGSEEEESQPQPKPVVRRPPRREVTPPVIAATPVVVAEEEKPVTPPPVAPAPPSRSNQWAMALRDRKNIRNVIISNEIIGRPVSLREM